MVAHRRDAKLWCPYCDYFQYYLKGSTISKDLARTGVETHIGSTHPGRPVYARMTTQRYEK